MHGESHRPFPPPFNCHITKDWIQARSDPIRLVFTEDNGAPVATFPKRFQESRHIVRLITIRFGRADIALAVDLGRMADSR